MKSLCWLAFFVATGVTPHYSARAADYPTKPVRVITTVAAGSVDVVARAFAEALSSRFKQSVVVEPRPGAESIVALNAAAAASPDGYTLLVAPAAILVLPATNKAFQLDLGKDLTPIAPIVAVHPVVVVRRESPYTSIEGLFDAIKANPGKFNFASGAANTNLQMDLLKSTIGLNFETLNYAGGGPLMTSLLSGQTDFAVVADGTAKPLADQKVRVLATVGGTRSPVFPMVRAFAESSLPPLANLGKTPLFAPPWFGLFGPANLPPDIVRILYASTREVVRQPEFVKRMTATGVDVISNPPTPEEFRASIIAASNEFVRLARTKDKK